MPKIIPELRERILETTEELYINHSFDEVDMRKIANICGIAVGTLYNYFPNKEELFTSILERTWNKKIERLAAIAHSNQTTLEKINQFLGYIYKTISLYKGIGNDCFERHVYVRERDKMIILGKVFEQIIEKIVVIFMNLINDLTKEKGINVTADNVKRISFMVLFSLPAMIKLYPNDEKENINFCIKTVLSVVQMLC